MKFIVSNEDFTSRGLCTWSDRPPPPCPSDRPNPGGGIPPCSRDGHVVLPPVPCSGDYNPCLEDFNPYR